MSGGCEFRSPLGSLQRSPIPELDSRGHFDATETERKEKDGRANKRKEMDGRNNPKINYDLIGVFG